MRNLGRFLPVALSTVLGGMSLHAQQQSPVPSTVSTQAVAPAQLGPSVPLTLPHSWNPLDAYRGTSVPAPNLANSPRIDSLIHDGVLELSLKDAIALALENNLDLAIARYNIPIAEADVLRTKAGGSFLGVNTGVVQNTPGGGAGGFGTGATGAGAGGTSGGAGGAGAGASGLVQSTLGTGTPIFSYDPAIIAQTYIEHFTQPLSNLSLYGVETLQTNNGVGDFEYTQAFPTGTRLVFNFDNQRVTYNSPSTLLLPELDVYYRVELEQQLLAGFGFGPNLRYLKIAKNNQKISDQAFKLQVITTVTQIANMYWDLVNAYEDEQVKSRSLDFANQTLESGRKQLQLQAIPAMDVLKDEAEVATREQDLSIAKSTLQFQELLIKNALTKNLDDPILESMPVRPLDLSTVATDTSNQPAAGAPSQDIVNEALARRLELAESEIDLKNREISRAAARNNLLPSLSLVAWYGGTGLGGLANPASHIISTAPKDYAGALTNSFNSSAPDYYAGFNLDIPLRNRVAKSDQYRSELEMRQAELRMEELRKQIRIEVRNAQYSLEQSQDRVVSALKGRDLAQKTFDISVQEQKLGSGSALESLSAQHDLAIAESALVTARTAYQKAKVELDRATGLTLESNSISIESARTGVDGAAAPPSSQTGPSRR